MKLQPVIGSDNNNIRATLNQVLTDEPTELLLICGSFFIMTDVREYFGYPSSPDADVIEI